MSWLVGCSLFTDLGGLTSGSEGGSSGSPDATASSDGGGLPTGDATTKGDAPQGEAGGDAEGGGGGGVDPLSCTPGSHLFCTNFDNVKLTSIFDSVTPGNGAISIENAASFSNPSALRIAHPGGNPAATPNAKKVIATNGLNGIKCRMRYRRETIGGGILVLVMLDVKTSGNARLFAELKDGNSLGKVYLEVTKPDGTVGSDFPDVPTMGGGLGAWTLLEWTLDFKSATSTVVRGGTTIDTRAFVSSFDGSQARSIELTVGLGAFTFDFPASPWTVQVDDLVCDAL